MKNYLAAQRYARALNDSIAEPERLEPALSDLQAFAALLSENADFRWVLRNPALQASQRAAVLDEVLQKMGGDPLVANLARELLRRGRIDIVEEAVETFGRMVDRRLNRVTARVTTAQAVTDDQAERIRAGLSSYSNRDVRLKTRIDPKIIGGVVVRLDGTVIDGSLRARLKQLRNALLSEENGTK